MNNIPFRAATAAAAFVAVVSSGCSGKGADGVAEVAEAAVAAAGEAVAAAAADVATVAVEAAAAAAAGEELPVAEQAAADTADADAREAPESVAGEFTQDLDAAFAAAAKRGVPVLLDFSGSDWCFWCQLMETNVFSKSEWKEWAASNLVCALVDFPQDASLVPEKWRGRNEELSARFGIRGFPTYVFVDAATNELGRAGASRDATPESFIAEVKRILVSSDPARIAAALEPEEAEEYSALSSAMKSLEAKLAEVEAQADKTTAAWREKILAAKGEAPEKLAAMRRAATREIAAAMSASHDAAVAVGKEIEKARSRLGELRDKAVGAF